MPRRKFGRPKGRRTKGYFYRSGRGWYTKDQGRFVPLLDEDGNHIQAKGVGESTVKAAHARYVLEQEHSPQQAIAATATTVLEVCLAYLRYAKTNGAPKTHHDRCDTLFDFCFGLPPAFRNKDASGTKRLTKEQKAELKKQKIHPGFGHKQAMELTQLDIDNWLSAHENWKGGQKTRVQAIKRALNYATERQLIPANPIRGYRTRPSNSRVTYITPEQEALCYEHSGRSLALALRVCIRTGARFGCEFAALRKANVVDHGERMEWVFQRQQEKTRRKRRIIRITDPEIIEIVRKQLRRYPRGPLFRNHHGRPWQSRILSHAFRRMKARMARNGHHLDEDCCMYSCRHTYAKRILQGYWSGKPTNIETLARLMGNTPQVCRDHYLQWSEIDNDPLWDAA